MKTEVLLDAKLSKIKKLQDRKGNNQMKKQPKGLKKKKPQERNIQPKGLEKDTANTELLSNIC